MFKYHTSAGVLRGLNSIFFNGQPYHVGAAALADWQAARLAELTGKASMVNVTNHPLEPKSYAPPITQITNTSKSPIRKGFFSMVHGRSNRWIATWNLYLLEIAVRTVGSIFLGIVFSYASCALIITPIQERVRKSKLVSAPGSKKLRRESHEGHFCSETRRAPRKYHHRATLLFQIQTMSGVRPIVYVGSNFAFDAMVVFITLVLCFVVMMFFNPAHGFTTLGETIREFLQLQEFASEPFF